MESPPDQPTYTLDDNPIDLDLSLRVLYEVCVSDRVNIAWDGEWCRVPDYA